MQNIIASYLVQKKECNLPGIGNLKINTIPASLDVANKQMYPSATEIIFSESDAPLHKDLVKYISIKQNVDEPQAAENITRWCANVSESLDAGDKINFESIGSLKKNAAGNIFLSVKKEFRLYDIVPADRVIHQNEEHDVLVGDRQTTSAVMNDYYKTEPPFKRKFSWKICAIVLFSLSLLLLIVHFSNHSFTTQGIGNQINISAQSQPVLHKDVK